MESDREPLSAGHGRFRLYGEERSSGAGCGWGGENEIMWQSKATGETVDNYDTYSSNDKRDQQ